jgi:glyoxylase-like metal-dependent hydrolase (beta-lactamase superfamily II)
MKIERFVMGMVGTNCYLIINEETKQTVLVDPADCPKKLTDHIEEDGLQLEAILLTHGHYDHIMGIDALRAHYPVPVYAHEAEEAVLTDPHANLSDMSSPYVYKDAVYVKDGQVLELAGCKFKVLHTPGHTPGGCCYYVEEDGILISGDTLFCNSVGRTDFPGGSMSQLVRGIKEKLMVLPDETQVLPGHMDLTNIGYERNYNPFL